MLIPLPPIEEQLVIVYSATRMLSTSDEVLRRVSLADVSIVRLPNAVLAKAFRCELVGIS